MAIVAPVTNPTARAGRQAEQVQQPRARRPPRRRAPAGVSERSPYVAGPTRRSASPRRGRPAGRRRSPCRRTVPTVHERRVAGGGEQVDDLGRRGRSVREVADRAATRRRRPRPAPGGRRASPARPPRGPGHGPGQRIGLPWATLFRSPGPAVDYDAGLRSSQSRPASRKDRPLLHFSYGAASHVGLVRDHTRTRDSPGPTSLLVADGVGGAAAGEVASATTTYVVTALAMGRPEQDGPTLLAEAVATAHQELQRGARADEARHGMATTLTAVLAPRRVTLVHVGDSRAYLWRDGESIGFRPTRRWSSCSSTRASSPLTRQPGTRTATSSSAPSTVTRWSSPRCATSIWWTATG